MKFGGLQKSSLIDYPGKLSCVVFLSGCNFECPYCHNPELAKGCCTECFPFLQENRVYDFLENRKGFLDGVVISGGEPTLHDKELISICERVKTLGYPVKLDTNGSKPEVIQELIRLKLVDYLAMDIKTDPLNYAAVIKTECSPYAILSSIRVVMESGLPYEFKTTCVRPLVDKRVIENICQLIGGAKLYALQQFRQAEILNPDFFVNKDRLYTDEEIRELKSVADKYVGKCIVR